MRIAQNDNDAHEKETDSAREQEKESKIGDDIRRKFWQTTPKKMILCLAQLEL